MNIIILMFLLSMPAQAEIFKCRGTEQKTIYQSVPCPTDAVKQKIIDIEKPDPAKAAEAEARLKAWQTELAAKEAKERQAKKEQQEALDRQAVIDALNRSAAAQKELAEATKQPVIIHQPIVVNPFLGPHQQDTIPPHRERKRPRRSIRMD